MCIFLQIVNLQAQQMGTAAGNTPEAWRLKCQQPLLEELLQLLGIGRRLLWRMGVTHSDTNPSHITESVIVACMDLYKATVNSFKSLVDLQSGERLLAGLKEWQLVSTVLMQSVSGLPVDTTSYLLLAGSAIFIPKLFTMIAIYWRNVGLYCRLLSRHTAQCVQ